MKQSLTFQIGKRKIGPNAPVYVIAEAANCHEGEIATAKKMVDAILASGADAIKFQLHIVEEEMTSDHPKFETQRKRSLSVPELKELKVYCKKKGIDFLVTPFSRKAVDILDSMNVPAFKIGSGEVSDPLFMEHVAKKGRPVIFSTGMMTDGEVKMAVTILKKYKTPYVILHCISEYPAEYKNIHLPTITSLKKKFGPLIGFSDHTIDGYSTYGAVALGAVVVEKHLTLDRATIGTADHKVSLEPHEWPVLVQGIRAIEKMRTTARKGILPAEKSTISWARHSVVTLRDIRKGQRMTRADITTKRPLYDAIPAHDWKKVVGARAVRDLKRDTRVKKGDIRR